MSTQQAKSGALERYPLVHTEASVASALIAITRRLAMAKSIEEIMAVVTPAARDLLAAGGVTFVLRDGECCYYAEEDAIGPLWKGRRFPLDACISGWCMKEARGVRIRDIYQDARIPENAYRPTFVHSLAMVPVRRDDPIAAMGAYWPEVRDISAEELSLLQTIADAAALAVASVRGQEANDSERGERRELGHRVKNIFAVIEAIARQGKAESLDEYRNGFLGRIDALQRVHAELFRSDADRVMLETLLRELISAAAADAPARLSLAGPAIQLPAKTAQDVALIAHELAANAVRHGALSAPEGRLDIRWVCEDGALRLHWEESGGPPAAPPAQEGFGTRFVKGVTEYQMGGQAELAFDPAGFRCELALPLPEAHG